MQLLRFLGFTNSFHSFIRSYSTLASPLSTLTSTQVMFTWSMAADWVFWDLKHHFTTAPILVHPDPSRQFVVEADASDVGVGVFLSQGSALDLKLHL